MAVDFVRGPLVEPQGAPASGLAGAIIPVQFGPISSDTLLFGPACLLMGWSIRESTGLAGALVELYGSGSATGELLASLALTSGFDPSASQTPSAQSSSGANAQQVATITPGAGLFAFITTLRIDGLGATGSTVVTATLTGVQGGTRSYPVTVPTGATVAISPVTDSFGTRGLQSSAAAQAISLTVPAFGAGNTLQEAEINGYVQAVAGSDRTQTTPSPGLQARGGVFIHVISGSVKGTVWVRD